MKHTVMCCNRKLEYSPIGNDDYKAERAICSKCNTIFEIKSDTDFIYVQKNGEGNFKHFGCGKTVMVAQIIHSLWDKRFECAGSGETTKNSIPYCPEHEKKPDWQGMPIYY